jgi:transcriptional regulator with XRE-family HTH domain
MESAHENRSRIAIPPRAHPLVRALYRAMAEKGVTYDQLAARSGVKKSRAKAWRSDNSPGINAIQATLNVVGLQALPVPGRLDVLPPALAADLEAVGARHGIPAPIAELMMVAADQSPTS